MNENLFVTINNYNMHGFDVFYEPVDLNLKYFNFAIKWNKDKICLVSFNNRDDYYDLESYHIIKNNLNNFKIYLDKDDKCEYLINIDNIVKIKNKTNDSMIIHFVHDANIFSNIKEIK